MYKSNIPCSADVVESYIRREIQEINKMYPTLDPTEKYKLYIQLKLWVPVPFPHDGISAEIQLIKQNGEFVEIPKYKIRTPYPNKGISLVSMQNGSRYSNIGIPLFFDTFDELCQIKELFVLWSVKLQDSKFNTSYVSARYNLSFKASENRVYSIESYEYPLVSFCVYEIDEFKIAEKINDYLSQYNGECFSYETDSEQIEIKGIANTPAEIDTGITFMQKILNTNTVFKAFTNAECFTGYTYNSTEEIVPESFSRLIR